MSSRFRNRTDLLLRISVILGMLLMGACSANKTKTPNSATSSHVASSPGASTPSDTPINGTPDVNAGNVTITFANLSMDSWTDYQPLADAFHKQNPNITVIVIPHQAVSLNLEEYARQADVVYLDGSNPAMLPGFLSLQPLLDATLDFKPDDFWPGSLTACENDQGIPYGLPMVIEPEGIYYDPQLFDQASVAYPQPGWTWDQFEGTINQVGRATDGKTVYGLVDGPMGSILSLLINKALVANNGRLDPQPTAASLDWYVQLAKAQKLYPFPSVTGSAGATVYKDLNNVVNGISGGKAAMWIDVPQVSLGRPQRSRSVYMPFPIDPADDHTTPMSVTCAAISSGTKSPQAAWAWLNFLSQSDLSGAIRPENPSYLTAYLLPGRQSLTGPSAFWSNLTGVQRNAISYALHHAWYYPSVPWSYYTTAGNVEQAVVSAIQSGADLASALQGVAQSSSTETGAATPTAAPVVLNTAPVPTPTNAQTGLTINFMAANFNVTTSFSPFANRKVNLKALASDFKKSHPDITVNFSSDYAWSSDGNDFQVLSQNNDCFEFYGPGNLYTTLDETSLLDLTPFLETEPGLLNDFYSQFLKPFQQEGKLYGLPADVGISYIGYNADLLTRLGIPLPKAGWTVDDLISIANQTANPSATPPVYGYFDSQLYLFHALNVPFYDTSVQPPAASFTNNAELARALTLLGQLYESGAVISVRPFDFAHYSDVAQGRVALWITDGFQNYNVAPDGEYNEKQPIYEKNFPFKVGYVPLPLLSSGAPSSMFSSLAGYYISSHTTQAKAQACWDWISYLSGHPSIFGGYSPRQSVLPEESVGQDPQQFAVVQEAIQQYSTDGYRDFYDPILMDYMSELGGPMAVAASGGDVAAALADAQRVADEFRACLTGKDLTGLNGLQIANQANTCFAPFVTRPAPPP